MHAALAEAIVTTRHLTQRVNVDVDKELGQSCTPGGRHG